MSQNDNAVFTASRGYLFVAPVNTSAPSPADISAFDPVTFGCEVQQVAISGSPTGGSFTLTFDSQTTAAIPYNATAAQVQVALEALSNIAPGDVVVTGGALPGTPVKVAFTGTYAGVNVSALVEDDALLTGGTSPAVTVTVDTAVNGWVTIGHTSDDELPEFGFDGGTTETRGTWQNAALREVVTENAVDFVTFQAHQFDENTLKLYYGVSDPGSVAGRFDVNETGKTTEKALLMVVVDGDLNIAAHAGKTSIRRNEAISLDPDNFAALPLRATFLKGTGPLLSWISEYTGVNVV